MCEVKNVLIVAVLLLAAAGFHTYQGNPKVGQHSEIKSESLTRFKKDDLKSDNTKNYFHSKSDNTKKILLKIMLFTILQKLFLSKSCFLENVFSLKSCFLK